MGGTSRPSLRESTSRASGVALMPRMMAAGSPGTASMAEKTTTLASRIVRSAVRKRLTTKPNMQDRPNGSVGLVHPCHVDGGGGLVLPEAVDVLTGSHQVGRGEEPDVDGVVGDDGGDLLVGGDLFLGAGSGLGFVQQLAHARVVVVVVVVGVAVDVDVARLEIGRAHV